MTQKVTATQCSESLQDSQDSKNPVCKNQNSRQPILLQKRGSSKNGESPEEPSKNLVLEMLPAMTAPNAEVCEC
ncbi:hypothetical protein TNCV_916001 [Trichonephila clavipes]|nr:hypothetical protein TNCV_916001 [Trichonephila clavipes]